MEAQQIIEHSFDLTSVAVIIAFATMAGITMARFKQPAVIGYIFVGLLLGPGGFELVEGRDSIELLAELGIILLLYFIGLELNLQSFIQMWRKTIIATIVQIAVSVLASLYITHQFGIPLHYGIIFGFCLALSSTAVAAKLTDNLGERETRAGKLTIGILIAQDLAVAPMLLIIGGLAGGGFSIFPLLEAVFAIGLTAIIIYALSRGVQYNLPFHKFWVERSDLAPLWGVGWCFLIASITGIINLSPAFGAFIAGVIAGNSLQKKVVMAQAGPIQTVLLMVFFLSIGMLIDMGFIWDNLGLVLSLLTIVMVFKTLLNVIVLRVQNESWQNSLLCSLMLAQMGEFSFVLVAAASDSHIIDAQLQRIIVAVTVLSLILSPIYIDAIRRLNHRSVSRISNVKNIIYLIYFKEWRFTLKFSTYFWRFCLHLLDRFANLTETLSSNSMNIRQKIAQKAKPKKHHTTNNAEQRPEKHVEKNVEKHVAENIEQHVENPAQNHTKQNDDRT